MAEGMRNMTPIWAGPKPYWNTENYDIQFQWQCNAITCSRFLRFVHFYTLKKITNIEVVLQMSFFVLWSSSKCLMFEYIIVSYSIHIFKSISSHFRRCMKLYLHHLSVVKKLLPITPQRPELPSIDTQPLTGRAASAD